MLLLALLAAAPGPSARFVMTLGGIPSGVVSYTVEKGRYTYRSSHVFRGAERARTVTLTVDPQTPPEVLFLSRRPPPGCLSAVEELSGKLERVCISEGTPTRGTIDTHAFEAHYDARGRLERLVLDTGAEFIASAITPSLDSDPFSHGFSVEGRGPHPTLDPPLDGAHFVTSPTPTGSGEGGSCLDVAHARAAANPRLVVTYGLVVEDGHAWPHAWLRDSRGKSVDPSLDEPAPGRQYLALPADRAGAVYLELLAGTRHVVMASAD